jgi:hypothetical protein
VDLNEQIFLQGQKITHEFIVNNAFIAWEWELNGAKLTESEPTKQYLARYLEPVSEILLQVERNLLVQFDFPDIFEVLIVKRMQQVFASPGCPNDILLSFFGSPEFGACKDLVFSYVKRLMLQISPSGKGVRLQDKSANRDAYSSLSLKPPPKSAPPDAFLEALLSL